MNLTCVSPAFAFCFAQCLLFVSAQYAAAEPSKHVLIIGVDGAGGQYVEPAATPAIDALAAAGAVRYDFYNEGALTPDPPEGYGASGVNWSTIVTGASAEHHGVIDNSFAGAHFDQYPHFFQRVKGHDPNLFTASISHWAPINTEITPDEHTDFELEPTSDAAVRSAAVSLMQNGDPDAVFLHFDEVDGAGHGYGWGGPQHTAAIEMADSLIGDVIAAMNARPGVVAGEEDWLVIVTADHGAAPGSTGHFASQGLPNWEVPFVVSGPSVAPGAPMQRGSLRDVASTALWHLGIDPFLAEMDGAVRGLVVPPPTGVVGDFNGDGVLSGNGAGDPDADDVATFLAGWLVRGGGSIEERYARGDANYDGVTDLQDWALINNQNPTLGAALGRALTHVVPEPAMFVPSAMAIGSMLVCRSRGARVEGSDDDTTTEY
ncbi:phosphoglyceromutase [Pseudobythopirellula maris]|uniref:Phosphoglyceromutase n=1 Tax=Pseudobythopirellula maris TaxID=2527991 RepID=A0A5C5ZLC6_9BACT|nr:alkaline phosphatase family protein [Pseudobythopirellula maris]TWT87611.1 phosphoglyceromutase [Pseudobythopirellula maris]